jgi:hypothetical protein
MTIMTARLPSDPLAELVARHGGILDQHSIDIHEVKSELRQMRDGHRDIAEMFGKVMAATTHTADLFMSIDTTLKAHAQQVDRRFAEMRVDQDRVCALKHGALEQRIGTFEQGKMEIAKKFEDMGEITKITYLHNLESQRDAALKEVATMETRKFEWKKLYFGAMIGIVSLVLGSALTYAVSAASRSVEASPAPTSSSAVVR